MATDLRVIYLNIGEVYMVLLEETKEFLEVVFGWEIVTTIWPYSLEKTRTLRLKKLNFNIINNNHLQVYAILYVPRVPHHGQLISLLPL
jgi:hypothetical protein